MSNQFFENEPQVIRSHLSKKGSKAIFLRPITSKNTPEKKKEKEK